MKGRSPLTIFMALMSTNSNMSMSFFCWRPESWTQCSICSISGLRTAEQTSSVTSHDLLAMLLFMHSRILLVFWAASAHCRLSHTFLSSNIPKPFFAFNPFIPQFVLLLGIAPTYMMDLTLGLVELHEVPHGTTPQACPCFSGSCPFPHSYQQHHSA